MNLHQLVHDIIPNPPPLLAENGLFLHGLFYLGFTLHLILVNIVVGTTCMLFIRSWRAKKEYAPATIYGPTLHTLPTTLALTVNLGLVPFLFIQLLYGQYLYPSAILMATWWLSMAFLVMLAYYGLYLADSLEFRPILQQTSLGFSLLFLLTVAFILTNLSTLVQRPELWLSYAANASGSFLNLRDPELFLRYGHTLLACLATGGLVITYLSARAIRLCEQEHGSAEQMLLHNKSIRSGLSWYTHATALQFIMGSAYFMSLPAPFHKQLMGGNMLGTAIFTLALCTAIASIITARRGQIKPTILLYLVTIFSMTFVRSLARDYLLNGMPATIADGRLSMSAVLFTAIFLGVIAIIIAMCCTYTKLMRSARQDSHLVPEETR